MANGSYGRVDIRTHAREVESLHLVGLSNQEAIAKAMQGGFQCTWAASGILKSSRAGGAEMKQKTCFKRSAELICPQYRYVHYQYSVTDEKVLATWSDITEQGCW